MAGHYETLWEAAKNHFESDSGRVIAAIEKKKLAKDKKKVDELKDGNTNAPKLKKPAEKYKFFGIRKSSGMEPACKKLDKAAGAKEQKEKDIQKAYDDYDKDRKTYQKMLDTYAADETKPYYLVQKQIKALGNAMVDIGEEFRRKHSQIHKQKQNKRNELIKCANDLSPLCDEMKPHLDQLRRQDDRLRDKNEKLGHHYKSVAAEAEKIINKRLKPGLLKLQKLASEQHMPNRIDAILSACKNKTDDDPFNSSDRVLYVETWFSDIKEDIEIQIDKWKKLPLSPAAPAS